MATSDPGATTAVGSAFTHGLEDKSEKIIMLGICGEVLLSHRLILRHKMSVFLVEIILIKIQSILVAFPFVDNCGNYGKAF